VRITCEHPPLAARLSQPFAVEFAHIFVAVCVDGSTLSPLPVQDLVERGRLRMTQVSTPGAAPAVLYLVSSRPAAPSTSQPPLGLSMSIS
jgi:hypothetical protein